MARLSVGYLRLSGPADERCDHKLFIRGLFFLYLVLVSATRNVADDKLLIMGFSVLCSALLLAM